MADAHIYFEPSFRFLICKSHGSGVHPAKEAIKRHLRGKGHHFRGEKLRRAISKLLNLPLNSLDAVLNTQPSINEQPITPPLPYLIILRGWSCTHCAGAFLSTSLEVVQRHTALRHGRRRGDPPLWDACELQTFFSETKDRRYFRVARLPVTATSGESEPPRKYGYDGIQHVQALSNDVSQKKKVTTNSNPLSTFTTSSHIAEEVITPGVSVLEPWTLQTSHSQPSTRYPSPSHSIAVRHPFTDFAVKHVPLSISRLDSLFRSDAFRAASNPLFDGSHVDAALNIHAVFPESEEEPVFLNALLYSTVQITNHGTLTTEGHLLQERIVRLLNEKLVSPSRTLSQAVVGAIMILKATAYRTRDLVAHDTHTEGLIKALEFLRRSEKNLTSGAQRALFWLDLNAAILTESKRRMSHLDLPLVVNWQRERFPKLAQSLLPIGFARHQDILPYSLCECISDTVELQTHLRVGAITRPPHYAKFHQLDSMQASIESRLELQAQTCRQLGVVAEAVRLGVCMCCYCSWMETWNDNLIPCKLAEKLIDLLEPTVLLSPPQFSSFWLQHIDILLWLLFVGSNVVNLDSGQCKALKSRQSRLITHISSASTFYNSLYVVDVKQALQDGLQDFIYKDGWLPQRCYIKDWSELELSIDARNT